MENHCCALRREFIYSDWMAKSEVCYSKISAQNSLLLPQHHSNIVFTNCTWQIIRDRTLSTTASATWIIAVFPTLRIISTISNHSLLHIRQCRKKIYSMCLVQVTKIVSNITTNYTGIFSTWSQKWRVQNEKSNLQRVYTMRQNYCLLWKLWARYGGFFQMTLHYMFTHVVV